MLKSGFKAGGFNDSFVSKKVHPSYLAPEPTLHESDAPDEPKDFDELTAVFTRYQQWNFELLVKPGDARYFKACALRAIAASWVTNPKTLGGSSLRSLARRLGVKATTLSALTAEFSREFGIKNHWKSHDWRKGAKGVQP